MSENEQTKRWYDGDGARLTILFVLGMLICLPLIAFNIDPGKDTSTFYTPMIREIAAGNFTGGYYAIIPPLFSTVGAIFCFWGLHCFTAAKLTSSLLFVCTIFPTYGIIRRTFGRQYAFWGCLLLLICHPLIRQAGDGLLDPGKMLFLTLVIYCLVAMLERPAIKLAVGLGAACAGLTLIRGEGILFAGMAVAYGAYLILRERRGRREILTVAIIIAVCGVLVAPWAWANYRMTGYPMTDYRQIRLLRPVFKALGIKQGPASLKPRQKLPKPTPKRKAKSLESATKEMELAEKKARKGTEGGALDRNAEQDSVAKKHPGSKQETKRSANRKMVGGRSQPLSESIIEAIEGFYPPFLWLTIIGLIAWYRGKKQTAQSRILLFGAITHNLLLFAILVGLKTLVQGRYMIATLPLLIGWTAIGGEVVINLLKEKLPRVPLFIWICIILTVSVLSVWKGNNRLHMKPSKREAALAVKECGQWLRTEGSRMVPEDAVPPQSDMWFYHNGQLPILFTDSPQAALWGEADGLRVELVQPSDIDQLVTVCQARNVHFILNCGLFDFFMSDANKEMTEHPDFQPVFTCPAGENKTYVIFAYLPNLQPSASKPLGIGR